MKYWLFPCNPKQYDLEGAFESFDKVEWHQHVKSISVGDKVFIYVGKPFSTLKLLCEVIEVNIPKENRTDRDEVFIKDESLNQKIKHSKSVMLKKIKWIDVSLDELKSNGLVGNVQGQRSFDGKLLDFLMKKI